MKLLGPAAASVQMAEENHQESRVSLVVWGAGRDSGARFIKNVLSTSLRARSGKAVREAMIGQSAAAFVEKIMPPLQRCQEVMQSQNRDIARTLQPSQPFAEYFGAVHRQRFVGTKSGI